MRKNIRHLIVMLVLSSLLGGGQVYANGGELSSSTIDQAVIASENMQSITPETQEAEETGEKVSSSDSLATYQESNKSLQSSDTAIPNEYSNDNQLDKDLEYYLQRTDDLFPLQESRSDLNGSAGRRKLRSLGRSAFSIPTINAGESGRPRFDFIDVSSWNNNLKVSDYIKIKSYGVKSVVVKLTEATSYQNPYAAEQIKNAQAAGLKVHVYHYSWFTNISAAKSEAEYFAAQAKKLQLPSSTIMVNDIEEPQIINSGDHTKNSQTFAQRLSELGFKNTMHYVGRSWVDTGKINAQKLMHKN